MHQLDKLLRNRQAEPGAAKAPGDRRVGLIEFFKQVAATSLNMPMPVSATSAKHAPSWSPRAWRDISRHASAFVG
jgi:hypothetical protein